MNNAFARIGRTCVSMALAGGLSAVALLAAPPVVTINLPHSVEVGSTVLPSGNYTLTSIALGAEHLFVLRSAQGTAVTLQARRIDADSPDATTIQFSTAGDAWHFDKLLIQGDTTGYEFIDAGDKTEK